MLYDVPFPTLTKPTVSLTIGDKTVPFDQPLTTQIPTRLPFTMNIAFSIQFQNRLYCTFCKFAENLSYYWIYFTLSPNSIFLQWWNSENFTRMSWTKPPIASVLSTSPRGKCLVHILLLTKSNRHGWSFLFPDVSVQVDVSVYSSSTSSHWRGVVCWLWTRLSGSLHHR